MHTVLASALALAMALPAEGQFMRSMMSMRGSSGSFMSSSTWFQGSDGHMHHKLEEQRTGASSDEYGTMHTSEKTVCKDGHCHKETVRMMMPNGVEPPCGMRQRLHAMMGRLMGPPPAGAPEAPRSRWVLVSVPSLRGVLLQRGQGEATQAVAPAYRRPEEVLAMTLAAPALATCCLVLAGLLAALKCCNGAASARVPVLRELGEPLAPTPEVVEEGPTSNAPMPAVAPAPAALASEAAKRFLQGVCSKAQANVEAKAVKGYLASVYARAA